MQGVPAASEGMVLPGLCVSSALRILSACLYLLSSCAACLLRAGLSDVSVLSALSLLPTLHTDQHPMRGGRMGWNVLD
jgi:hypothetical protein